MRVDLGCGSRKHTDCYGIDVDASSDADMIHDWNKSIPLADDSVHFVMACRSLEYAKDLMAVMKEIYRICRHKAIVCIVAPYAQTALHLANPEIRYLFNEYTPFYFTSREAHKELLGVADFIPESFNSDPSPIDLRLLRMEIFYFPDFGALFDDPEERFELMQGQINVVDEIMYHFVVVKEPLSSEEYYGLANGSLEEPLRITERREKQSTVDATEAVEEYAEQQTATLKKKPRPLKSKSKASGKRKSTRKASGNVRASGRSYAR